MSSRDAPGDLSRTLRCPKCRQTFETMRRWRMACPECGHEWEEASVLSAGDKLSRFSNDAGEYLFVWLCWAGLGSLVLFIGAIFAVGFLRAAERGGVGAAVVVIVIALVVVGVVAAFMRPSYEATERMMFWRMGWRGGRNDPKDNWRQN